jgi:hypothetical protein
MFRMIAVPFSAVAAVGAFVAWRGHCLKNDGSGGLVPGFTWSNE